MKTDTFFYRLFKRCPGAYFELIGQDPSRASQYTFHSVELKQLNRRIDGVLIPIVPSVAELPLHFLEVQFFYNPKAYSNLMAKVFVYLDLNDPAQDWRAVILFDTRATEPTGLLPYQELIDVRKITRLYLDEVPARPGEMIGTSIARLVAVTEDRFRGEATKIVDKIRAIPDRSEMENLLELVESAAFAKIPTMTREEFSAMFQLEDYKKARLYKEFFEEGSQEGHQKGLQKGLQEGEKNAQLKFIRAAFDSGLTAEKIAAMLKIDVDEVRQILEAIPVHVE